MGFLKGFSDLFHKIPSFEDLQRRRKVKMFNNFNDLCWLEMIGGKEEEKALERQFIRTVNEITNGGKTEERSLFYDQIKSLMDSDWFNFHANYLAISDTSWGYLMKAVSVYKAVDAPIIANLTELTIEQDLEM